MTSPFVPFRHCLFTFFMHTRGCISNLIQGLYQIHKIETYQPEKRGRTISEGKSGIWVKLLLLCLLMIEVAEEKQLPNVSILPSYQLWGFSLTKDDYNAVLDRFHLCPGYEPTTGVATGGFATWEKNSSASERTGLVCGCVSVYLDRQDRNTQSHLSLVSVRTSVVPEIWTLASLLKLDSQNLSHPK